ncbi:MAG: hypothetical protein KAS32_19340 [Candidatus Peribacteraceae bacterium]|nr:hypothetical protein [Candidatus Peribacteraceae bacterium]
MRDGAKIVGRDYMGLPVPEICQICRTKLELEVLKSPAGYYLGRQCNCGPFSRESEYFHKKEVAKTILKAEQKREERNNG